jgi:UDPglucose 6-dehydrogenase
LQVGNETCRECIGEELKVSVIGLGKLGMPLAAVLAEAGNQVFIYDVNEDLRNRIKNQTFYSDEPGLMDILVRNQNKLMVSDSILSAISDSDLSFIIVPTPSNKDDFFDNTIVMNVLSEVSNALKNKNNFHVIDIVSTVMPGSCDTQFIPLLMEKSGKKINVDFGFCYNPEFIALGSVIKNMKFPDMHLIGASNIESGLILQAALKSITGENVPTRIMNLKEAELVKISVNNYVTTKISFANMLMQVSDKLGGIDIDVVTDAIGLDSRIGKKYLKGGTSFGGPCFPRDTRALAALMLSLDLDPALPEATSKINGIQNEFLIEKLVQSIDKSLSVSLLGFSYKPNTAITEESTGLRIAQNLMSRGINVYIWEPLIGSNSSQVPKGFTFINSIDQLDCRVSILTREFNSIELEEILDANKIQLLIDPWRQLSPEQAKRFSQRATYIPVGRTT